MKRLITLFAGLSFLICLLPRPAAAQAVGHRPTTARATGQVVAVKTVTPTAVQLVAGGAPVRVTLQGSNIEHRDLQGEALRSGNVKHSVQVRFDKPGAKGIRHMELTASAQAGPGDYAIRLVIGSQKLDLPLRVQVGTAPPGTAAKLAPDKRVGQAAARPYHVRPSSETGRRASGASRATGTRSARNILASPAVGAKQLGPRLVVQTGTKEFENYANAIGFAEPWTLTFQWSHHNPEVAYGQWEVTHDGVLVMKGNTGAAPAPGQTKNFDIDFRRFVNLPAPDNPVQYRVCVRGKKALLRPVHEIGGDDESLFVTPPSNAVVVTYASQPQTEFTEEGLQVPWPERDDDLDGFKNYPENYVASEFRPYFIFDADESYRLPNEPVVIFQARCVQSDGDRRCTHAQIKYYYLFQRDGGWGSAPCSPWCDEAHNGDNQHWTFDVFYHTAEKTNPYYYWYLVSWDGDLYDYRHPVFYLSAGKHHDYLSTSMNHVYKEGTFGCCDDVAGDGDRVLPDVKTGDVYHNVGEPGKHLIDDLGFLGYPGECAWCGKAFRGGLEDDEGASTPLGWM